MDTTMALVIISFLAVILMTQWIIITILTNSLDFYKRKYYQLIHEIIRRLDNDRQERQE